MLRSADAPNHRSVDEAVFAAHRPLEQPSRASAPNPARAAIVSKMPPRIGAIGTLVVVAPRSAAYARDHG